MYFWYFLCMILAHFQVFCLSLYYGWWTPEEILPCSPARHPEEWLLARTCGGMQLLHCICLPPRWTKARQRWHLHFCLSFYHGLWTLPLHCICPPGGQRLDKGGIYIFVCLFIVVCGHSPFIASASHEQKLDKGAHVQKTADLRPKHNKVVNQPAKQPPHGWTALNCPFWSRINLAWI